MALDFLFGAQASGDVGSRLMTHNMDPGAMRPFRNDDPRDPYSYITVNQAQPDGSSKPKTIVQNAYAPDLGISTLRVREWIQLDQAVEEAARPRMKFTGMLRSNNLEYTIPNGMGRTVLQYQSQTAPGTAKLSMDGVNRSKNDRPLYDLRSLPLPIAHEDFSFTLREIMTSRNNNTPIDTTMAMDAGTRVAELIERLNIGTAGAYQYAGAALYGITNDPSRIAYTIADPTGGGWTARQTLQDVLAMKQLSMNDFRFGPWALLFSHEWEQYLDEDFSAAYPNKTLRQRLMEVNGVTAIETLDFLTGYQCVLIEMQTRTIREVMGMDITTLQWPGEGGMEVHFKVMAIMVPQIRYDYYGNIGLVHGTV